MWYIGETIKNNNNIKIFCEKILFYEFFFWGKNIIVLWNNKISPFIRDYISPIDTSIWKQILLRTSCIGCNLNKFSMIHPNIGYVA
jgi:hypothetical protein